MPIDTVAVFKTALKGANLPVLIQVDDTLKKNAKAYGMTSNKRIAAFMAQVAHESGQFNHLREIWGPTAEQRGYEFRSDLGNTQTGDGKRFLGRGLLQITGRGNYRAISMKIFGDNRLEQKPELLEQPVYATLSALQFWADHKLNEYADSGDFTTLTRRINGGTNGLQQRRGFLASLAASINAVSPFAFLAAFLSDSEKKKRYRLNSLSDIIHNIFNFKK